MTVFLSIFVPTLLYFFLPRLLQNLTHRPAVAKNILITACALFFISWYLLSPHIEGEYTALTTHFIGGGLFTGFLWLYLKRNLKWKSQPLVELFSLYLLVSGLGVATELFEFFAVKVGILDIPSWDTWWDLLANTSGALLFWVFYMLTKSNKGL